MAYNPDNQYRCTIIRGKAKSAMDNLLPFYAGVLNSICPCELDVFMEQFNDKLSVYMPEATKKTLDNHRTEIAGKLFGMYYVDENGVVSMSERTTKLLDDSDQPAFFKDICNKMQFPNGMSKLVTTVEHIEQGLNLKVCSFILKVLKVAQKKGVNITKSAIGYYILNALDVLRGHVSPDEVVDAIHADISKDLYRRVHTPGKASSYDHQHINEMIGYMELANLVRIFGETVKLNALEHSAIDKISESWHPMFNFYDYDLTDQAEKRRLSIDWQKYYGDLSEGAVDFITPVEALAGSSDMVVPRSRESTVELGDAGELYVFNCEKKRVAEYNARDVNRVVHLGKTKGLGYDIQSVCAGISDLIPDSSFIYIEVKATKRVTAPRDEWNDTVNLTRNEWLAAESHLDKYFIYRVYFTQEGPSLFVIPNPVKANQEGLIYSEAISYRVDFSSDAGDFLNHEV